MGSSPGSAFCPLALLLGMWEVKSVLYECIVRALCLQALLYSCYDSRETPVQGCEVWFSQHRLDRVER